MPTSSQEHSVGGPVDTTATSSANVAKASSGNVINIGTTIAVTESGGVGGENNVSVNTNDRRESATTGAACRVDSASSLSHVSHNNDDSSSVGTPTNASSHLRPPKSPHKKFATTAQQIVVVNMLQRAPLGFIDHEALEQQQREIAERETMMMEQQQALASPRGGRQSTPSTSHLQRGILVSAGGVGVVGGNGSGSGGVTTTTIAQSSRQVNFNRDSLPFFPQQQAASSPPTALSPNNLLGVSHHNTLMSSASNGPSPAATPYNNGLGGGAGAANASITNNPLPLPRITNAQLAWRNALNRPATCEKNQRDLDFFRTTATTEQLQINKIIDAETISRRQIDVLEYEQRNAFNTKHERRIRYLARLVVGEQAKKSTVDKYSGKIHGLFAAAQAEDKKRREAQKQEALREKLAKAHTYKQQAHEFKQMMRQRNEEEWYLRQELIAAEREAAKKARSQVRLDVVREKRNNARSIHNETVISLRIAAAQQERQRKKRRGTIVPQPVYDKDTGAYLPPETPLGAYAAGGMSTANVSSISPDSTAGGGSSMEYGTRQGGLPIYSFLKLPPLTRSAGAGGGKTKRSSSRNVYSNNNNNNNNNNNPSTMYNTTMGSSSINSSHQRYNSNTTDHDNYNNNSSDDDDPYGVLSHKYVQHRWIGTLVEERKEKQRAAAAGGTTNGRSSPSSPSLPTNSSSHNNTPIASHLGGERRAHCPPKASKQQQQMSPLLGLQPRTRAAAATTINTKHINNVVVVVAPPCDDDGTQTNPNWMDDLTSSDDEDDEAEEDVCADGGSASAAKPPVAAASSSGKSKPATSTAPPPPMFDSYATSGPVIDPAGGESEDEL